MRDVVKGERAAVWFEVEAFESVGEREVVEVVLREVLRGDWFATGQPLAISPATPWCARG